jgi:hypothetical protein
VLQTTLNDGFVDKLWQGRQAIHDIMQIRGGQVLLDGRQHKYRQLAITIETQCRQQISHPLQFWNLRLA